MTRLPDGWSRKSLRSLGVKAQPGFPSGRHNRNADGIVHLRPMNISRAGTLDLSDCRWVRDDSHRRVGSGDVLFNNTNSPALVGKTALVRGGPFAYSNHMTRLRADASVLDPAFLAMQLHALWLEGYFEGICSNHVNQASVASRRLLAVEIAVPPLAEQRRVVEALEDHLSRLDAAEQYLASVLAKSALTRDAVLQSVIVPAARSEPGDVPGLLHERVRRFPPGTKRGRPSPALPAVIEAPWKGHWPTVSLEQATDPVRTISYGILKPGPNLEPNGVPYVRVLNMRGDRLAVDDLHHTSHQIAEQYSRASLEPNDVLVSIRGTYGRVVLVPPELKGANITQDTARLAILPQLMPSFVALVLRSPWGQAYMKRVARGVGVKGVNIADLRCLPLPLPSLAEQARLVAWAEALESDVEAATLSAQAGRRRSVMLRRALLAAAFSGQVVGVGRSADLHRVKEGVGA